MICHYFFIFFRISVFIYLGSIFKINYKINIFGVFNVHTILQNPLSQRKSIVHLGQFSVFWIPIKGKNVGFLFRRTGSNSVSTQLVWVHEQSTLAKYLIILDPSKLQNIINKINLIEFLSVTVLSSMLEI